MRIRYLTCFGLVALCCAAVTAMAATPKRTPSALVSKGGHEQSVMSSARPVVKLGNVSPDQLIRLPANTPIRRHVVGQGAVQGNTAGDMPTGELVYSNTMGEFLFPPGAGVRIADDIRTACAGSDMTWLEITVAGGGDGTGPGFSVEFELFDECPSDGGVAIPGTFNQADLTDDGAWIVALDLEDAPLHVSGGFWLAVTVSTNTAGWVVGQPAEIGTSDDIFDGPFPCTTFFGGFPPNPHASFFANVYAQNCLQVYLAYEANAFSGFFIGLTLAERFADDILPISAPMNCEVAQYDSSLAGLDGAYTMLTEIFSDDDVNLRPLAPVPGTQGTFAGIGNGFLETSSNELSVPAMVPTPLLWITYDVEGASAGPILNADFPEIGLSEDCFSIFDNPDPGQFSQCVWWFGGCPGSITDPVPCGTFQNKVFCVGTEPAGACCVTSIAGSGCTDNVPTTQCDGRFMPNTSCAPDPFDPPCGTASCCMLDGTCEDLTQSACDTANGQWQPGQFCGVGDQTCPNPACIAANQPCDEINFDAGGCNDPICCTVVCNIDDFCCAVAWDDTCVGLAGDFCSLPPPDECVIAETITCGSNLIVDNTLATDVGSDPGFSCHNDMMMGNGVGSVWAKFEATETSARLSTCNSEGAADDSLLAVYTGTCAGLTEIGCSDDVEGCGPINFGSDVCVSGLIPGQTYFVQLAAWTNADRGRYNIELQCPAPETCGPPEPPVNDNCANAIPINDGTYNFTTIASTTDGPALPASCNEGFGIEIGRDIWYNYTAPGIGTVTVDLCSDNPEAPAYDSRIAIYNTCACPAVTGNTHDCNDDGCGDPLVIGGESHAEFAVNSGTCYKIRIAGFGLNTVGTSSFTVSFSGTGASCPAGAVTFTNPAPGTVDARQPNPVNSPTPAQGISTLTVTAPVGADDGCWRMCETASLGGPNSITSVTDNGAGTYTISLARPITRGAVTRVSYTPDAGAATTATLVSHPANVNGDSTAAPTDILRIIDCLNNVTPALNCPWGIYSQDIDQSGVFGPSDILRTIDLLNGADVFDVWNNTTLPSATCTP